MNKDNLQYAFETQQSINDRFTDIIGNLTSQIAAKDKRDPREEKHHSSSRCNKQKIKK